MRANREARIMNDGGALITVDGQQGYGQVIAKQAIELGIERARKHGVAVVGIRNASHVGRVGAWAEQAAAAGMISLHFVNTSGAGILVAPFGGSDRRLSVNPIAMGVPRPDAEPIIHDMSTGIIAAGKVRVAQNKGELVPEGCLIDGQGRPTRDPAALFADPPGALLTVGGHKGYGLSIFCEVLAGALTGGGSSHPDNPDADRVVNNMLSILIDPGRMAGMAALASDLARLEGWVKASPPAAPGGEILFPGEPERRLRARRLGRRPAARCQDAGPAAHRRPLGRRARRRDRGRHPDGLSFSTCAAAQRDCRSAPAGLVRSSRASGRRPPAIGCPHDARKTYCFDEMDQEIY